MTKKRNKKTTLFKQKQSQVVNVYTAAKRRNPLSQNSAPIIRHVYHQVPTFNPIPVNRFETNQQPVGTKSESEVLISGLRAEIKMIQKGPLCLSSRRLLLDEIRLSLYLNYL